MFNPFKKKDKGPYPRSFANRLTKRIMLTLLCVMSVVSLIIFGIALIIVYANAYMLSNRILASKCQTVESTLTEVYVASVNTVPDIENSLNRPDRMEGIMKRIVELNPHIRSCGISFREGYYPAKGRWFCPYAMRDENDSIVLTKTIGGIEQNYLQAAWFNEALEAKEGYWSKPFFSENDSTTPLIAYLLPIRDERDSTVAVMGVDVSLKKLSPNKFKKYSEYKDNSVWSAPYDIYFFAIDSMGTYLMHPDEQRIAKQNFFDYTKKSPEVADDQLAYAMISNEKGHRDSDDDDDEELILDGEKVFVSYKKLAHTPWSMAFVIPSFFIDLFGYILGGFLLFFIVLGLIVVFFAGRRGIKKVSQPLRQLAASADEVAKGNFNTPLPVIDSRDEIHLVRDSFENMQQSLKRYVEELRETTAQNASMESELKVAHDIQMSMLPKTFPPFPERSDIDIFGSLTPAKGVGGDLFDFHIRDEQLFFCIGDVSGKGVPASLYMAVTRSLFRNVSANVSEPEKIMHTLNKAQSEGNDTNMFVTLFVGVLDLSSGLLRYCNAGHDAPLLIGRGVKALPCEPNLPIGIIGDYAFNQQSAIIEPGTTIFLFTDGLNEAENNSHAQFGDDRVRDVACRMLEENRHQPKPLITHMEHAVHAFVGDAEQSDDLTMLAIRYMGQEARQSQEQ